MGLGSVGGLWGILEASRGPLGASCFALDPLLSGPRALVARPVLCASWAVLRLSGAVLGSLGGLFGRLGAVLGASSAVLVGSSKREKANNSLEINLAKDPTT
eukprot:6360553-Pyramimonas_sp.AAC.1